MTRTRHLTRTFIAGAVLLSLLVTGCSLASEPVPMGPVQRGPLPEELPPVPLQTPNTANGALIFAEHCAECHGVTGDGVGTLAAELEANGAVVPVLADPEFAAQRTPAEWFTQITNGSIQSGGLMPPWRNSLSEAQRWDVTYFLYSLSLDPDQLALAEGQYADLVEECAAADTELAPPPVLTETASQSPQTLIATYLDGDEACVSSAALPEDEAYALAIYLLTRSTETAPHAALAEESSGDPDDQIIQPEQSEESAENAEEAAEEVTEVDTSRGRVIGSVLLEEAGAITPVNTEVRLEGLALTNVEAFEQIADETVMTDEDGNFVFEDLPWDIPQSAYIVTVQYDGLEYGNGVILDGSSTTAELPITVYESTSDPAVVQVDSMHIYTEPRDDGLVVSEILVYSNTSNSVYIAAEAVDAQPVSIALALPPEATQVQFQEGAPGQAFTLQDGLYYDTRPLYPGAAEHTVVVQYLLPGVTSYEFDLPVLYQANLVTVIVGQDQTLQSRMLEEGQQSDLGGQPVTIYQGGDLSADSSLAFRLRQKNPLLSLLPGALALILVVGGGGTLLLRSGVLTPSARPQSRTSRRTEELLQQIVQLDADYEAGRINRIDYEADRAQLAYEVAISRD